LTIEIGLEDLGFRDLGYGSRPWDIGLGSSASRALALRLVSGT